jgi:TniQ
MMNSQPKKVPKQRALLVRPHPYRNEGPKGYLLRLAEANWMLARDLQSLGLMYELSTLVNDGLLPLKELDPELHSNIEYYSELLFNKKRIWNHQHARFCPHCLADDIFWRVGWELLFHDACSIHGTWLIDQCSSCGDKISWERESLIRCQCGADLRAERASDCPEAVKVLSKLLNHKVNPIHHSKDFLAPFMATDIEQTQRIIRYLGTYMNLAAGKNPLKIQSAGLMSNSWLVTTLAAEICTNWPEAFYQSLDNIQREVAADKPTLSTVFGHAYHYLYKGLKGSAFSEVKEAFETWLSAAWKGGIAKRNKRLTTVILEKAQWIPANLACESLGISHQRLAYLIREGVIEGETYLSEKGRKFVMVRRDNLETVKHNLSGEIDMKTAGILLGLSKKRVRQLLRLIFPDARKSGTSASSPWTVSRFEVNKLLDVGESIPKLCIPDEGDVSLNHMLRFWAWRAEDIADLIHAVRTSEFLPHNIIEGSSGISGWVFNENRIKAWREKSIQGFGNWLNVTQVAKVIGIKQQIAYSLVNIHLIKYELMHGQPNGGKRVRRTEVDNFKRQYIFATEVGQRFGVHPLTAISILHKHQITPISGPGIDGGMQVLYLRNDEIERVFNEVDNGSSLELVLYSR